MSRNVVFAFNILIVLGLITFSLVVYADLPEQIPSHINYKGRADSTTDTNFFIWMAIPFLSAAILALFGFLSSLIDKKPDWVNVPNKKLYLALSDNARNIINQYFKVYLLIMDFMITVILFEVQIMIYQAAMSKDNQADIINVYFLYVFGGIFLIYVFFYLFKFAQMIKTAWLIENQQA